MKRYFYRLKILHKLIISSFMFALPIFILLFYMVSGFNESIRFTRLEIWGCELFKPLENISENIYFHQFLTRLYLKGDREVQESITQTEKKIEESFNILLKEAGKYEKALQIDEGSLKKNALEQNYPPVLYSAWKALASSWRDKSTEINDQEHNALIQSLQTLIRRIGDTSHVVLDTDLDTYYLIDASILRLSKSKQKIGEFILFSQEMKDKKRLTPKDNAFILGFVTKLEDDLEHIREGIVTSIREDENYYGENPTLKTNIMPPFSQYQSAVNSFSFLLQMLVGDPSAKISNEELTEKGRELARLASTLQGISLTELQFMLNKRLERYETKRLIALSLSILAIVFAGLVVFLINLGITRPLEKVMNIAGDIASGDIRKAMEQIESIKDVDSVHGGQDKSVLDESILLIRSIKTMTSNIISLLNQIGRSGRQVTDASNRIASSAENLESAVSEQASSINEVSATSKEIKATSQEFAKTMGRVAQMASKAAELSRGSMKNLSHINDTMKNLYSHISGSSEKMKIVDEKMEDVSQIIITITKIANQINLLSLNAAIEAEKAGEYGIGFSVVAREIRRLADQTALAAIDIETMINETQEAMKAGVSAVEAFTEQTRMSTEKIAEISVDLLAAIEHTQQLVPQFEVVNEGMQMQSESAAQISTAIEQVNETTRYTRELMMEFKKVTQQLNEAIANLKDEVTRFNIDT
ncbi:MAG TPA: methyl-accepting chemotaxis protein [Syntrophorhabdaceae bacterium]|nr:methyl-accepting chemotaxis protein [Syntrophorhabdaceae bacterium]HOL05209.1 methyl-accepting chemotaxis protein [Syntrophorhabdaceae bacterium]HON84792.1 methyl-accepting chemotaxis protein [Syntrophorhabdaceae bacterium]HOT41820.1 methyl-accepting chemotaxis protein [Syntrophorhabdaceae bacterium]HPC66370.1 methyl-accepting chemotaxis protein [Syntrophorhabdaceae bacterium]